MASSRILYINHDNPNPSGGVRNIYSHVRHLVHNGLQAYVVQGNPQFAPRWFEEDVPILYYQYGLNFNHDDIVIIPEDHREALDALKSVAVHKIVFCQNHFYIFAGLGQHRFWQEIGIQQVFASSEVIASFVRANLGWRDVPVVPYAVKPDLFKPLAKKLQIAYMPRKRAMESKFIYNLTARTRESAAGVPWVAIDGVSEAESAKILGESAVFLSMSHLEGFGLPPVEAMACGCAVVGFHGFGGMEYATPENGFWCEEGNLLVCARMLQQVVDLVRSDSPELKQVLASASGTAARFTPDHQEGELLRFIRSVRSGNSPI